MEIIKFINISLRGLTLLSRVFLFLFLAKYFEVEQVGLIGLIMASISLSVYAVGFDFYTFTTRELLRYNYSKWGTFLKSQCMLHIVLYFLMFPLLSILFIFKILPWSIFFLFFLILFLDHITVELSRLLITSNNQISSSIVIFFRSGFWCIVVSLLMIFLEEFREIEYILLSWVCSLVFSLVVGLIFLSKINIGGWSKSFNYKWIIKGLKIAIPLLISTLIIRTIFTIDRYWIEFLLGSEILGVYVLFIGFATSIITFMDAGVFSFSYPALVRSHNLKNKKKFNKEAQKLKKNTIILSLIAILVALIVIKPILNFVDKSIYNENIFIFYWLLVTILIYNLSMIPHYLLYAQRHDKTIVNSHFTALIIFVLSTFFISKVNPNFAVIFGLISSFSFILTYKILILYLKK